jgi:hypothetical protein
MCVLCCAVLQEDAVREVAIDPFNPAAMGPPGGGAGSSSRHQHRPTGLADSSSHRSTGSSRAAAAGSGREDSSSSISSGSQEGGGWRPQAAGRKAGSSSKASGDLGSEAGDSSGSEEGEEEDEEGRSSSGRRLRARCWMCSSFPMSLSQLLPLLEVAGSTITPLSKVAAFLARAPPALAASFPVKVQVPLLFTVHATVSFKHFQQLGPAAPSLAEWEGRQAKAGSSSGAGLRGLSAKGASWAASLLKGKEEGGSGAHPAAPPPPWFQVPAGYSRKLLGEVAEKHGLFKGMGASKASSNGGGWKDMGGDVEF